MNAEFILLVYHQLICHADSDETQAALSMEQRPRDIRYEYVGSPLPLYPQDDSEIIIDDLPAGIPPPSLVTPRDNRPKDTEKTLYRWNHVSDQEWHTWGVIGRKNWVQAMIKKYNKSVVA